MKYSTNLCAFVNSILLLASLLKFLSILELYMWDLCMFNNFLIKALIL